MIAGRKDGQAGGGLDGRVSAVRQGAAVLGVRRDSGPVDRALRTRATLCALAPGEVIILWFN